MSSYNANFSELYDHLEAGGIEGDVGFYVTRSRSVGGRVLDVGCGTGRFTVALAQAGVLVVGIDNSPAMLERARTRADALDATARQKLRLVEGDMRDFRLAECFDLVIIPYRSFMHLLSPEDQRRCLARIHEHLHAGGQLILDIYDVPPWLIRAGADGKSVKSVREINLPDETVRVTTTTRFEVETQLMTSDYIVERMNPEDVMKSSEELSFMTRWTNHFEFQYLLELCGFRIISLLGGFDGRPFKSGGEQVWVCKKVS